MPYKPYWLQRLPEIVERLKTLSPATIDRPTFESIFRLRRRRAIELMHVLGSQRGRRGFVLDRCALLEKLESLDTVTQYRWEQQARSPRVRAAFAVSVGAPLPQDWPALATRARVLARWHHRRLRGTPTAQTTRPGARRFETSPYMREIK